MSEQITIPDVSGLDSLQAALSYAQAGLYVGPVRSGTKHPGSVLGDGWQTRTSRDPEVIAAWFAGTSHGVFLHCGRSGLHVFDVDRPERVHEDLHRAFAEVGPPYQTTRSGDVRRGHYLFAVPPDRDLGNGAGSLGRTWGEVRGRNGVIVVTPSVHEEAEDGGLYAWGRTGPVPVLPDYVAAHLDDALDAEAPVTDAEVEEFLQKFAIEVPERPELVEIHAAAYNKAVQAGASRHDTMTGHLAGAMKEAAAGLIDARTAVDTLESVFLAAVGQAPIGERQKGTRTGAQARSEWHGLLAWAVAQGRAADPEQTRTRVTEKVPDVGAYVTELEELAGETGYRGSQLDDVEPRTLGEAHEAFTRWLGEDYDLDVLDAVLCTAAAEQLPGDPAWLLVVSGSGAAKTETVGALSGAGATITSTIASEGALLSGTSKRERTKDATGGLLRKIGSSGLLVVKDVTSILSMDRNARGAVLAALREVYDGLWERNLGSDGGRTLTWTGRLGVVGAVTTAWDAAHAVVAAMGDRFVLIRLDSSVGRQRSGRQAISNAGGEEAMRAELAAVVGGVLATVDPNVDLALADDEVDRLLGLADIVTLARTAVERDYRGDVIDCHAPEMPTRFAKQLTMIVRGGLTLGMDRDRAVRIACRCARDSAPPLRLAILLDVLEHPEATTHAVRKRLEKPRATVDRELQALHMLGLLSVDEIEDEYRGRTTWHHRIADGIDAGALASMGGANFVTTPPQSHKREGENEARLPTNKVGTTPSAAPVGDPHLTTTRGDRCPGCGLYPQLAGHAAGCPEAGEPA